MLGKPISPEWYPTEREIMSKEDQEHIQSEITRTVGCLQEIEAGPGGIAEKQSRAAVNVCFLLQEIAATSFPLDVQTEVNHLVVLFMNMR